MIEKNVIARLKRIVGADNVLTSKLALESYSYDSSLYTYRPDVVAFPENAEQVADILRLAYQEQIPVVPRGAGTNLSGGTIPIHGGIVMVLTRMNRILEIDPENQVALVEPGVTNLVLQKAVDPFGFMYAPDPASQKVSTMGGNVAEGAGGIRGVKYGVTRDHVIGLEVILPTGEMVRTGGLLASGAPEIDLTGLFVSSEGTLGVVTKILVRLLRKPELIKTMVAVYDRLEDAGATVSEIVARGIIPTTMEIIDRPIIKAVEEYIHIGLPTDAEALLLIEVDGFAAGLDRQVETILELYKANYARDIRAARDSREREALWLGRRSATGALARLKPSLVVQDATVPRNKLPEMLHRVSRIAGENDLLIGMIAHAGDGNLHPQILFDTQVPGETKRVEKASAAICREALELGGTLTGEHGVGIEKLPYLPWAFGPEELALMRQIKETFDPKAILNAGKAIA